MWLIKRTKRRIAAQLVPEELIDIKFLVMVNKLKSRFQYDREHSSGFWEEPFI